MTRSFTHSARASRPRSSTNRFEASERSRRAEAARSTGSKSQSTSFRWTLSFPHVYDRGVWDICSVPGSDEDPVSPVEPGIPVSVGLEYLITFSVFR